MTRLLLTLLALFTGLVASGATAEVRVGASGQAVAAGTMGAVQSADRLVADEQGTRASSPAAHHGAARQAFVFRCVAAAPVPTVLLGADRARE